MSDTVGMGIGDALAGPAFADRLLPSIHRGFVELDRGSPFAVAFREIAEHAALEYRQDVAHQTVGARRLAVAAVADRAHPQMRRFLPGRRRLRPARVPDQRRYAGQKRQGHIVRRARCAAAASRIHWPHWSPKILIGSTGGGRRRSRSTPVSGWGQLPADRRRRRLVSCRASCRRPRRRYPRTGAIFGVDFVVFNPFGFHHGLTPAGHC